MQTPVTVVISCAGRGSRLGLGTTKALAVVCGRPLIAWHLDLLKDHDDIRIVVGFDAPRLIEAVTRIRKDIVFVFNRDYLITGTAASIAVATEGMPADADILSLDGDLLVEPRDVAAMLRHERDCLGVLPPSTSDPVMALTDYGGENIIGFSRAPDAGNRHFEWSGLFRAPASLIREAMRAGQHRGHVFEMFTPYLPMRLRIVDAAEIDTPEDFARAEAWLAPRIGRWSLPE
jgi:choline kinase